MLKKMYVPILIIIVAMLMMILIVPTGHLFGSTTDWFSQHVDIADTLRSTIYKQGLFPNYVDALGGGENVYAFSYYGLFRLDILISLLLPMIAMKDIIICSSILSFIASLLLFYYWIRQQKIETHIAFITTLLLATSSLFFHSHRQIMFVNYMPFLILSLLLIDRMYQKKASYPLIITITLILSYSFFFSISCAFVLILYFFYRMHTHSIRLNSLQGKTLLSKFILIFILAFMLCGILLIPTLFVLLAGERSMNSFHMELLLPTLHIKNFFYDGYGMGLTLYSWIALTLSLKDKVLKRLSIPIFICLLFPVFSYILNGTLYLREKIFLPFLPLVLYIGAKTLQQLMHKQMNWVSPWLLLTVLPLLIIGKNNWFFFAELFLIILILCLYKKTQKQLLWLFILCVPFISWYKVNQNESFLSKANYNDVTAINHDPILETLSLDDQYRSEDTRNVSNPNLTFKNAKRSGMYTSMSNHLYTDFFYNIAKNAIPTRNEFILALQANPIFQEKMGIKYLYTDRKNTPKGYQTTYAHDNIRLLENDNVLPIAYASDALYSEAKFDTLAFPYTLDVLYNRTLVKDGDVNYNFNVKPIELTYQELKKSPSLAYKSEKDTLYIHNQKKSKITLQTNHDLSKEMLMLSFDVKDISNIKKQDLSISINGIQNKLSSESAPYPNHNTTFTYVLSSQNAKSSLDITLSSGEYALDNIQACTLPYHQKPSVVPLQTTPTKEVLKGNIKVDKDMYFVTSLPMQKGYKVFVDGKSQDIEIVNRAFVGFPIKAGAHQIVIRFTPPGKTIGMVMSIIGLLGSIIFIIIERRNKHA